MPLSNKELLNPRFIVQMDYPKSEFQVGTIIYFNKKGDCFAKNEWESDPVINKHDGGTVIISIKKIDKYTEIFRKLDWWEYREIEEMPEYMESFETFPDHHFVKVTKHYPMANLFEGERNGEPIEGTYFTYYKPATKQQYENHYSIKS